MKLLRPCLGGVLAVGLWLAPSPAQAATSLRLGLGADYWFVESASFQFTLGVETKLSSDPNIDIGGRFGAVLVTNGDALGVPIDLVVRANLPRQLYIEGLVGPWLFFEGDAFRAHGAFGFGIRSGELSFGLEVGYLSPEPTIGLRLGYRF